MPAVRFERVLIADERYESVGVFDVDNDGVLDIVSGGYWYPGPDFRRKCRVGEVMASGEYFDDFATIAMDVNGDGYTDFITGGWWGGTLCWRENPAGDPTREWPLHEIAEVGPIETIRAWDVDGDGRAEVVPNTPGGPVRAFKLLTEADGKGTGSFREHVLHPGPSGHGMGFGDLNGDGRGEVILRHGWLAPPAGDPLAGEWTLHEEFDLGSASVPILVADVNGDGVNDLIVGQAHDYGLHWYEQRIEAGRRSWIKHPIDPLCSQYHDMFWTDIDGDGECELVTGKRYRAHCGKDPGGYDSIGLYYFKWTGEGFAKQVIDFGPPRQCPGAGIHFQIADLNGNGLPDIVVAGKGGLYLYRNLGVAARRDT